MDLALLPIVLCISAVDQTAVDESSLSGHVVGVRAGQIRDEASHVVGGFSATQGDTADELVVGFAFGGSGQGSPVVVGTGTIQLLQYVLLAAGAALSVYTARRIAIGRHGATRRARDVATPVISIVLLFAVVNAVLFALPMAHRM